MSTDEAERLAQAFRILSDWRKIGPDREIIIGQILQLNDREGCFRRVGAATDAEAVERAAEMLLGFMPSLAEPIVQPKAPATVEVLTHLISAWRKAADQCRRNAYGSDSGLSDSSRAIFAGRSDGYQNCADTLEAVMGLVEASPTLRLEYKDPT